MNIEKYKDNWKECTHIKMKLIPEYANGTLEPNPYAPPEEYYVPYGKDKYGYYGELMPDGLTIEKSKFRRIPDNDMKRHIAISHFWRGHYYLDDYKYDYYYKLYAKRSTPIGEYDSQVERMMNTSKWLCEIESAQNSNLSKDNKNGL